MSKLYFNYVFYIKKYICLSRIKSVFFQGKFSVNENSGPWTYMAGCSRRRVQDFPAVQLHFDSQSLYFDLTN